jgi:hypothetical protein
VLVGVLAIATSVVMLLSAWLALIPALPLLLVILSYAKLTASDGPEGAMRARAETAMAEARRLLAGPVASFDLGLSLQGELDGVERDWRAGRRSDDDVLEQVEDLLSRTRDAVAINAAPGHTDHVTAALRRGDDLT